MKNLLDSIGYYEHSTLVSMYDLTYHKLLVKAWCSALNGAQTEARQWPDKDTQTKITRQRLPDKDNKTKITRQIKICPKTNPNSRK